MLLKPVFEAAWDITTTYCPEDYRNPAWGQCKVTSLLVNWIFGGEIVFCEVYAKDFVTTHWYNLIEGEVIDLTRKQFEGMGIASLKKTKIMTWIQVANEMEPWEMELFTKYRINFNKAWIKLHPLTISPVQYVSDVRYPTFAEIKNALNKS